MTVGRKLRKLRTEAKMTQLELSNAIYIRQSTLSHYENGKRRIPADMIETISRYFNVPSDYFADQEEMDERR